MNRCYGQCIDYIFFYNDSNVKIETLRHVDVSFIFWFDNKVPKNIINIIGYIKLIVKFPDR